MWKPSTASTSARPRCWPCGWRWSSLPSAPTFCSSTAATPLTGPVRSRPSSRATRRAFRSPPPASWPKSTATGCWSSSTASSPAMASPATRATAARSTWPHWRAWDRRRCIGEASTPLRKRPCNFLTSDLQSARTLQQGVPQSRYFHPLHKLALDLAIHLALQQAHVVFHLALHNVIGVLQHQDELAFEAHRVHGGVADAERRPRTILYRHAV